MCHPLSVVNIAILWNCLLSFICYRYFVESSPEWLMSWLPFKAIYLFQKRIIEFNTIYRISGILLLSVEYPPASFHPQEIGNNWKGNRKYLSVRLLVACGICVQSIEASWQEQKNSNLKRGIFPLNWTGDLVASRKSAWEL